MSFSFLQLLTVGQRCETLAAQKIRPRGHPPETCSERRSAKSAYLAESWPGAVAWMRKKPSAHLGLPTFSYTGIYHISGLKTSWPSINTGSWFVSGSALIQLSRGLAALHQLVVGAAHAQIWQVLTVVVSWFQRGEGCKKYRRAYTPEN